LKQASNNFLVEGVKDQIKGRAILFNERIVRSIPQTVLSIFCWPLYLKHSECIVWEMIGKDRVPNKWVRNIVAYGLTSLWLTIISVILYLISFQIVDWRREKIDEKRKSRDSFSDRETSRDLDQISSKIGKIKKTLTQTQIRGGSILDYSEPLILDFLPPAFMFISLLRITKLIELKVGEEAFKKIVKNPNLNLKMVKRRRRWKVRPLLVYLAVAIRSRMGVNYVNIGQESRQQICSIAPIERLYCLDFEKTNVIQNENAIEIQPGNNTFLIQQKTTPKIMTVGEFEFKKGVDEEGNFPILKRRNLSRIHHLKRNRVGTIGKLIKESQSLETIYLDEVKPLEVSPKIPVSNKPLKLN
jgi:hypothetical protein